MIAEPIRGRDAEAQLSRALLLGGMRAGCMPTIATESRRPWSSATFTGTQLTLVVTAPRSPALGPWLSALPLAEVGMRGYLLGSLAIDAIKDDGATVRTTLTALVIDE